jgi:hypothetical protein
MLILVGHELKIQQWMRDDASCEPLISVGLELFDQHAMLWKQIRECRRSRKLLLPPDDREPHKP